MCVTKSHRHTIKFELDKLHFRRVCVPLCERVSVLSPQLDAANKEGNTRFLNVRMRAHQFTDKSVDRLTIKRS